MLRVEAATNSDLTIVVDHNTLRREARPVVSNIHSRYQLLSDDYVVEMPSIQVVSSAPKDFRHQLSTAVPDPTFPGTRIPIYRVAALMEGGMTVDEVAEDFPSLSKEQIRAAYEFAQNNPPPPGVNYPQQSLKRLLRNSGFVPSK